MKIKDFLMPIAAGVMAIAITATPALVKAESYQIAQSFPGLEGINLSQDQKTQINSIYKNIGSQFNSILTENQQKKFESIIKNGGDVQEAFAAVNLSNNQKQQLQEIIQSARSQIESVLTQEQIQQLNPKQRN